VDEVGRSFTLALFFLLLKATAQQNKKGFMGDKHTSFSPFSMAYTSDKVQVVWFVLVLT
jgi:hypothetical protein